MVGIEFGLSLARRRIQRRIPLQVQPSRIAGQASLQRDRRPRWVGCVVHRLDDPEGKRRHVWPLALKAAEPPEGKITAMSFTTLIGT